MSAPVVKQGEVTTFVTASRRIILGALLSPYTNAFKEYAHMRRHSRVSGDVMITKEHFFDIVRRGTCSGVVPGNSSVLSQNGPPGSVVSNTSISSGSKRTLRFTLTSYSDEFISDDLEFIWSEITILLASDDGDGGRIKSKRLRSFLQRFSVCDDEAQRVAKGGNVAALDMNDVQTAASLANAQQPTMANTQRPGDDGNGDQPENRGLLGDSVLMKSQEMADGEQHHHGATSESGDDADSALGGSQSSGSSASQTKNINKVVERRLKVAGVAARKEIPVRDLIVQLCVASSPSPTITTEQCDAILTILNAMQQNRGASAEITRYEFLLLLKRHSDTPEIARLDLESLTLYLFPDDVIEVGCLRQLIRSCQVSSDHHGFAVKYAEQRLRDWSDAKELFFYIPFLVLYLTLVISGKFLTPRSYYGYGGSACLSDLLFTPSFTSCSYDAETLSECNQSKSITPTQLSSRIDWYYYMENVFVPTLWPENGTAASTVLGNDLRLVGAFKIRNMRVVGEVDNVAGDRYFGNISYYGTKVSQRYPPYGVAEISKTDHPSVTVAQLPPGVALQGFEGIAYRSCEELNATGSFLGNVDTFSCDGHAVVLPINTTRANAIEYIDKLVENLWIDSQTRAVATEFLVFHPQSTMFIRAQMLVEFQAGGGLYISTSTKPFTFFTFSSTDTVLRGFYILYFALLFFNIGRYLVWNVVRPFVHNSTESVDVVGFRGWMVLDFANYAMFLASAVARLMWMRLGGPEDPTWLVDYYPDGYEDAQTYFNVAVVLDSFNILLSVLGLLRLGKFIPAMGLVMRALELAAYDAAALLLVIVGTFLSLVVCAASVFGDSVLGYHTILWSAETLGQAFIGDYSYKPLHAAHPTFGYVFFFVFQVTITIILLNMFIAVFTDAFTTAMENSFNRAVCAHILDNTAQHPLVRSNVWSFLIGSMPVQAAKGFIERLQLLMRGIYTNQRIDFFSYDRSLAKNFDLLFKKSDIGLSLAGLGSNVVNNSSLIGSPKQTDGALWGVDGGDTEARLRTLREERVHASRVLLGLLDRVPIPRVQAAAVSSASALRAGGTNKDRHGATNIYDYIHDHVGHDYPLIMTFFVVLPQSLFRLPGEYLLNRTMGVFVEWQKNVRSLSLKADEDALLEIRLRSVVEEREGHAKKSTPGSPNISQRPLTRQASMNKKGANLKDPAALFLDRMDRFHRRLFLSILACSPVMEGAVTKQPIQIVNNNLNLNSPSSSAVEVGVQGVEGRPREAASEEAGSRSPALPFSAPPVATPVESPFTCAKDVLLSRASFAKIYNCSTVFQDSLTAAGDEYVRYMKYKFRSASVPSASTNAVDDSHNDAPPQAAADKTFAPIVTVEVLADRFMIPEASTIRLEDFRYHIYEEFGEQGLSFGFSMLEYRRVERFLEQRGHRKAAAPDVAGIAREVMHNLKHQGGNILAVPPTVAVDPQQQGERPIGIQDDFGGNNDTMGDEELEIGAVTYRGDEHLEDLAASDPAAFFIVDDETFSDAWKAAKGTKPSHEVQNRVFSLFPSDSTTGKRLIDMRMFLKFCRESIHAHKNVSFSRHFCQGEQLRLSSIMWILFYVPLFTVTLFFLFYDNPLGETIWLSEGLSGTFAPTSITKSSEVITWMESAITSIWPVPNQISSIHNNANFFVGTVRFRQQRVDPSDCEQQYLDYFGDPESGALHFPDTMSAVQQSAYTTRVQTDYATLYGKRQCNGAYDFGLAQSTSEFFPNKTNLAYESVKNAFKYQGAALDSEANGFNSKYPSGGYIFELNYTILGRAAQAAINELVSVAWIDGRTRVVILELIVLNYNIDVVARGRFGVEVTAAGSYHTFSSIYVSRCSYPNNGLFVFMTVVLWILIAIYIAAFVRAYLEVVRGRISVYGDNVVFAAALGFVEDIGIPWDLTIIILTILSYTLKFEAAAADEFNTVANGGQWASNVETAVEVAKTLKQIEGVNSFMVFVRFLYFIGLNTRRIALVFNTLKGALTDLVSILALWILALCACTLSAVVCFGYGTLQAYNIQSAFFDLFNTGSGGNPNYYNYTAERRDAAPVFYILFFVVCFFVLYNMVVAVLTGKFADVKNQTFKRDVVERVLQQEVFQPWYRMYSSYAMRMFSGFLLQEVRQLYLMVTRRWWRNMPLRILCQNPRTCWNYMHDTWYTLDTGVPTDVVQRGIALVSLAATVTTEQADNRWESLREAFEKHKVVVAFQKRNELPAEGGGGGDADSNGEVVSRMELGRFLMSQRPVAEVPDAIHELITYADRRLPLWNEYIYYLFAEERDHVERYLAWLPARLLHWQLPKMWRHAVEGAHYYNLLRSSYTVDLSESRVAQLVKLLPDAEEIDTEAIQQSMSAQARNNRRGINIFGQ